MNNSINQMEKYGHPKQGEFSKNAMVLGGLAIAAYVALSIDSGINTMITNSEFDSQWLHANSTPSVMADGVEQQ